MKSKLLSKHDALRSDDFKKDLEVLTSFNQGVLSSITDNLSEIYVVPSKKEELKIRHMLSGKIKVDYAVLGHGIDIAKFFLRCFIDPDLAYEDSPKNITEDLVELELIAEKHSKVFQKFLDDIKRQAEKVKLHQNERSHFNKCIPVLDEIEVAIDYRSVFEKEYSFDEDPASYEPRCSSVLPIAIIKIGTDNDKEFFFQLDKRTLQILINHLEIAKKQMDSANIYLNIEKDTK